MRVRFWGGRGSTPTPQKENMEYGGNTSCIEIRTDTNQILVFDGGTGIRLLGNELRNQLRQAIVLPTDHGNPINLRDSAAELIHVIVLARMLRVEAPPH